MTDGQGEDVDDFVHMRSDEMGTENSAATLLDNDLTITKGLRRADTGPFSAKPGGPLPALRDIPARC